MRISDSELVERYVTGRQSGTRIAKNLGVAHPTVYRRLRKLGVRIRTKVEARRSRLERLTDEELIERYVNERQTKPRIADALGVAEYTIHRRLRLLKVAGRWTRRGVIRARPGFGSGWIEKGYHRQVVDGKNVFTHRLIAKAKPGEIVHHRNGQRGDNRPANLQVFASNAQHARYHRMGKTA